MREFGMQHFADVLHNLSELLSILSEWKNLIGYIPRTVEIYSSVIRVLGL